MGFQYIRILSIGEVREIEQYDNVESLGYDLEYGEIFKGWNNNTPNEFSLYHS